jgi:membrane protein CcdC involved in cytochrome C biogenesis
MHKEIGIILVAIGCVFLLVPLFWLYPFTGFAEFILTLCLLAVLLIYAAFDVKAMLNSKRRAKALSFVATLILAIILSYLAVFHILPVIGPKLHI